MIDGMTEPVPPPLPVTRPRLGRPIAATVVLLAGAVLAVVGTFGPLISTGFEESSFEVTSWGLQVTKDGVTQPITESAAQIPPFGIPVVVAAIVTLAAAMLQLLGIRGYVVQAARARMVATLAAGLLIGAVSMLVITAIGLYGASSQSPFTVGSGVWTLAAAAVLAAVGAVLVPSAQPVAVVAEEEPEVVIYELEPETPPSGFPAP